jgi:CRP-like cAMP-binding protein
MPDMLSLSDHLPEVVLAPGDVLVREGNPSGPVWVLVSGELTVSKGGTAVNTISRSGAVIGEMSVLLGLDHGATVTAASTARLRVAEDGAALLASDASVMRLVAEGMARRLNFVSTYLADLKEQYGDAPGLSMVSDVLSTLGEHEPPVARPGSARDPDPDY